MVPRRPLRIIRLVLLFALLGALRATAQSPVDPGQLPGQTSFYLLWRGTPAGEVRAKNSVYALWDDPDFAPARSAFFASLLSQSQKQKDKPPALSPDEAKEYATLLDNPYVVGYLRRPEPPPPPAARSATVPKPKPAWDGMFFVYDRTGKEELLSKAVVRLRGSETDIPKLTPVTVAGVPALRVERKDSTTYWAEFGKYAVSDPEPAERKASGQQLVRICRVPRSQAPAQRRTRGIFLERVKPKAVGNGLFG
jgi:hypothetical protein